MALYMFYQVSVMLILKFFNGKQSVFIIRAILKPQVLRGRTVYSPFTSHAAIYWACRSGFHAVSKTEFFEC